MPIPEHTNLERRGGLRAGARRLPKEHAEEKQPSGTFQARRRRQVLSRRRTVLLAGFLLRRARHRAAWLRLVPGGIMLVRFGSIRNSDAKQRQPRSQPGNFLRCLTLSGGGRMAELAVHSSLQGPCSDHHEDQRLATFWHGTRVAAVLSLASAVALAVGSYTLLREPLVGVDDANIYMAYGRNVAAGHGMVYYAGGE